MKQYITYVILIVCCFAYPKATNAHHARIPEKAKIDITNTHINFQFEWVGEDPEFEATDAVEFEVIIITDNPKCFAQPPGGKDKKYWIVQNNFPASHDLDYGYTDVWNYWNPPQEIRIAEVEKYCGEIGWQCARGLENVPIADPQANFAVGTINPHRFEKGTKYWFTYPLEPVTRPECQARANRLAWVQINMTTFYVVSRISSAPRGKKKRV